MFRPVRVRPVRLFIPPLYSDRHLRLHKTHLDPEFLQLPRRLAVDVDAASLHPSASDRRPHPPRDEVRSVECHRFVLGSANNNTEQERVRGPQKCAKLGERICRQRVTRTPSLISIPLIISSFRILSLKPNTLDRERMVNPCIQYWGVY